MQSDLGLGPKHRGDDERTMVPDTPLYRQSCAVCSRPAVTLDADGAAACVTHADLVRKAPNPLEEPDDDA